MYYAGMTNNVKDRWYPSCYVETSLFPYINKYGWENIEHVVVVGGLDYNTAKKTEDQLILMYRSFGKGINKFRSGLIEASDRNTYQRNLYNQNQEYAERHCQYYRDKYANDPEWAEQQRQYKRNIRKTPEGKIYNRVNNFNHQHPDRAVETPMEAKLKYLDSGYIPQYIKHDDIDGPAE